MGLVLNVGEEQWRRGGTFFVHVRGEGVGVRVGGVVEGGTEASAGHYFFGGVFVLVTDSCLVLMNECRGSVCDVAAYIEDPYIHSSM